MRSFPLILCITFAQVVLSQKTDSLDPKVYHWNQLEAIKEDTRVRRQILEGSTTSLVHFEVHSSTLEPGKAPHPPHTHADLEELMIVKEGTVKITINGTSKILGAGSIAFAMPGDEHGIENAGNTEATYLILKYKGRKQDIERGKQDGSSFMIDWNDLTTKNTGKGYRRDFLNRSTSQLAKFEMHTTALNKDSVSHAPHTHVEEEVLFIIRGNVTMHIDGKLYPAAAGDIVFLPSMISHALLNTGKDQCEYFAIQWKN